jgi:hypothetical protein
MQGHPTKGRKGCANGQLNLYKRSAEVWCCCAVVRTVVLSGRIAQQSTDSIKESERSENSPMWSQVRDEWGVCRPKDWGPCPSQHLYPLIVCVFTMPDSSAFEPSSFGEWEGLKGHLITESSSSLVLCKPKRIPVKSFTLQRQRQRRHNCRRIESNPSKREASGLRLSWLVLRWSLSRTSQITGFAKMGRSCAAPGCRSGYRDENGQI